ncbi:MAG: hypothetical protein H0X40_11880 [Chthoniobacterales bacterium]|nr:hypothetical protein [Chthoniobacterales bacterium]
MSYSTELTDDYMGILHYGAGLVTGAELVEACRATLQLLQNTENFHFDFIDFSEVTELRITADEFDQIVANDHFAAVFRPDAVVVIVAPRDDVFETATEWERRVQDLGWKTYISRSRADADEWLRQNYPSPKKAQVAPSESESSPA